ncbi:MAG: TatD family hydrolase [Bacteroidales bacterium]
MIFVDTHSHIFSKEFNHDRDEAVKRAKYQGVEYMVLPNIDSTSVEPLLNVCSANKGYCFPAMGLHPTSVKDDFHKELKIVEQNLTENKYIAVGEIGIDLYWDKKYIQEQRVAFRKQLKLAKEHQLPVIIHSRNSFDEIFEIVEQENSSQLKGVFHSFTGNHEQYRTIIGFGGFLVGIGGVVTYKHAGVDKVVKDMDLNHIVLETDSPYLSPAPHRGKRNESANLIYIAKRIAHLQDVSLEQVAEVTTQNAIDLFQIK